MTCGPATSWTWAALKEAPHMWLQIEPAGFGPCFHLPGQPILEFQFFEPQPHGFLDPSHPTGKVDLFFGSQMMGSCFWFWAVWSGGTSKAPNQTWFLVQRAADDQELVLEPSNYPQNRQLASHNLGCNNPLGPPSTLLPFLFWLGGFPY